jgi:hypothetical protein
MKLFQDDARLTASMRFNHIPAKEQPKVTQEVFYGWPEHMRTEFALLAEEAAISTAVIRDRTGIDAETIIAVRHRKHAFALTYSALAAGDDEAVCHA